MINASTDKNNPDPGPGPSCYVTDGSGLWHNLSFKYLFFNGSSVLLRIEIIYY